MVLRSFFSKKTHPGEWQLFGFGPEWKGGDRELHLAGHAHAVRAASKLLGLEASETLGSFVTKVDLSKMWLPWETERTHVHRGSNRFWSFHNNAREKCPVLETETQGGFLKGKQGRSRDCGLGLCRRVSGRGCRCCRGGELEGEEPRDCGSFLTKKQNPDRK